MTNFIPGKVVKKFKTKKGKQAVIRYPKWTDLDALLEYINKLSKEDTYITYSGEEISKKDEMEYLAGIFKKIEKQDIVMLCCFVNDKLAANSSVERDKEGRKRTHHLAEFAIAVDKEFRGEGIGKEIAKTVMKEAEEKIPGLKMLTLYVYDENKVAQKLYNKLGFKNSGTTPEAIKYKDKYIGAVSMYKKL